jgi:pyrroloquinoline quinone biosynthesis protein B
LQGLFYYLVDMKAKLLFTSVAALLLVSCETVNCEPCPEASEDQSDQKGNVEIKIVESPSLVILGTIQDAGSPQLDCHEECCEPLHSHPDPSRMVVSIGIIDPENKKKFILEASPDMSEQLADLSEYENFSESDIPDGVLLTHAHIGHYSGLMEFGKEAKNTNQVPVYAMPRMKKFLSSNGPWDQLVKTENIKIQNLKNEQATQLTSNFSIVPFLVPHRDEYSETVGFKIIGPRKSALFIPDIDKWEKWEKDIVEEVSKVDYAFLDATFYDMGELPNRDMAEVPHPLIIETTHIFIDEPISERQKIHFIHFNHTNPILKDSSSASTITTNIKDFNIAQKGQVISMQ